MHLIVCWHTGSVVKIRTHITKAIFVLSIIKFLLQKCSNKGKVCGTLTSSPSAGALLLS